MNTKAIIGILVVLIAVLAIIFFTVETVDDTEPEDDETEIIDEDEDTDDIDEDEDATEEETTEETNDVVSVTYTNAGFDPETVTVDMGETVRFINESGHGMWVASDPHPSHTDYSDFDQRREVQSGEVYEFTFEREGSWGYHNHVRPNQTGVVVVE